MNLLITKVKRKLTYTWNDFLFSVGLQKNNLKQANGKSRCLIYHGIDQTGSLDFNSRFISQKYLGTQIKLFSEQCNVISLQQYFSGEIDSNKLNVCLTFDDGYLNNFKYVLPLIETYKIPVTFFATPIYSEGKDILWSDHLDIASRLYQQDLELNDQVYQHKKKNDYINSVTGKKLKNELRKSDYSLKELLHKKLSDGFKGDPKYDDYWRLMGADELRQLNKSPFVEIGSHGLLHNNLAEINLRDAIKELASSKEYLESILQKEIKSLAYPDGSYSRKLIDEAEKIGYDYQLAVNYLFDEDKEDSRIRDRIGMNPHCSWNNQVRCIIRGKYY